MYVRMHVCIVGITLINWIRLISRRRKCTSWLFISKSKKTIDLSMNVMNQQKLMIQPDCLNFIDNTERSSLRRKFNLFLLRFNMILSQTSSIAQIIVMVAKWHTEFNRQTNDHKMQANLLLWVLLRVLCLWCTGHSTVFMLEKTNTNIVDRFGWGFLNQPISLHTIHFLWFIIVFHSIYVGSLSTFKAR